MQQNRLRHLPLLTIGALLAQFALTPGAFAAQFDLGNAAVGAAGYTGGIDGDPNADNYINTEVGYLSAPTGTNLLSFGNTWTDASSNSVTYSTNITAGVTPGATSDLINFTGTTVLHHDAIDPGTDYIWYETGEAWLGLELFGTSKVTYSITATPALNGAFGGIEYSFDLYDGSWNLLSSDGDVCQCAGGTIANTIFLTAGSYNFDFWGMIDEELNGWNGGDLTLSYSLTVAAPEPQANLVPLALALVLPFAARRRARLRVV